MDDFLKKGYGSWILNADSTKSFAHSLDEYKKKREEERCKPIDCQNEIDPIHEFVEVTVNAFVNQLESVQWAGVLMRVRDTLRAMAEKQRSEHLDQAKKFENIVENLSLISGM